MMQKDFKQIRSPWQQNIRVYLEMAASEEARDIIMTTVETFSNRAHTLAETMRLSQPQFGAFYSSLVGALSNALFMSANSLQGVCENGHQLQYLREDDKLYVTCPCGRWLIQDLQKQP